MVCGVGYMRKPLLYAHMETANHLNDTIIINQPHISSKEGKEIVLSDTEENSLNDTDIVYLNLNEEDLLDEDEYVCLSYLFCYCSYSIYCFQFNFHYRHSKRKI